MSMDTGTLTPRTNDVVDRYRFTGAFGQPNGFGSMLEVTIHRDGGVHFIMHIPDLAPQMWGIRLDNEQRNGLAQILGRYQPRTWERVQEP